MLLFAFVRPYWLVYTMQHTHTQIHIHTLTGSAPFGVPGYRIAFVPLSDHFYFPQLRKLIDEPKLKGTSHQIAIASVTG